jgi:extracellular factor (EF) 3-hydroxypalmitic acid methyl ester biosynthesis protein
MDQCLADLRSTGLWGVDNRLPSSELWKVVGPLLEPGWMLYRARIKPRGYAGDYELLGRMYENRLCDDPLGRLLDRYFQEDAAPIAVRNRMRLNADWIVAAVRQRASVGNNQPVRIAVVGSAFGLDIRDALLQLTSEERAAIAITLLDLDPAAVDFARSQLDPLIPAENVTVASGSILKLPVRPRLAEPLQGTDLLFCPGIFDYLDDNEAAAILRLFYGALAPGGRMTVFQFAPHNPSRALMEWIANWYLIYRDEGQFRSVVKQADVPSPCASFGAEPLGVDLFVTAVKG